MLLDGYAETTASTSVSSSDTICDVRALDRRHAVSQAQILKKSVGDPNSFLCIWSKFKGVAHGSRASNACTVLSAKRRHHIQHDVHRDGGTLHLWKQTRGSPCAVNKKNRKRQDRSDLCESSHRAVRRGPYAAHTSDGSQP